MYRWPMRLASMAAYGAHPYGRTVTGTPESLAAIDTAQVRAFHAAHILRAATVIAVVGDVVPEETAALIDTHFAALRFQADAPVPAAIWPTVATRRDDARDKQQSAITLMFSGPARNDPARYAARVLSAIASGLGGRFFEQLRDRQSLAYTVSAFPVERRAGGAFVAYIATSPAREAEAREGLLREFEKLRAAAPTAEELDRAQHYLIGTHAIAQQSGGNVLGELVDAWLFGSGLAERREFATRIAAVTPDDIRALAERYFDPSRVAEGIVRGTSGTGSDA
jgi:zinc protease